MLAVGEPRPLPSSFRSWHDTAVRPHHSSISTASDNSSSSRSRLSDDAGGYSTVLTSPGESAMNASSSLAMQPRKKRKRLQRACVACHKAKRRCDGGMPCSNCDFSGRACSYSDAQGKAVPPTKRTLKPSEVAVQQYERQDELLHQGLNRHSYSYGASSGSYGASHAPVPQAHHGYNVPHYSPPRHVAHQSTTSPPRHYDAISPRGSNASMTFDLSSETRRELLRIFFAQVQPWSCILDEITFLRDLSAQSVPPALLYSIFAISSQYAFYESQAVPPSSLRYSRTAALVGEVGDGTVYADEAQRMLYTESRTTRMSDVDGEISVDTARALCLLTVFEHGCRRFESASAYIQVASKFITDLAAARQASRFARHRAQDSLEGDMPRKRLICLIAVLDQAIGVACGRGAVLRTWDLDIAVTVVGEAQHDEDLVTTTLFQQLKTALVFCSAFETHRQAVAAASRSSTSALSLDASSISSQARACETYLQGWADAMPSRLGFHEESLHATRQVLIQEDARHGVWTPATALAWSGTHICAEAAILLLQSATEADLSVAAAQNIAMILERMPVMSLSGPLGTFGIVALKAAAAAGDRAALRQHGAEPVREESRKTWNNLERTADMLAKEARLTSWSVAMPLQGLALGLVKENGLSSSPAHGGSGRVGSLSSWVLSPKASSSKEMSGMSVPRRSPLPHYALPALREGGNASGPQREDGPRYGASLAPNSSNFRATTSPNEQQRSASSGHSHTSSFDASDSRQRLPPLGVPDSSNESRARSVSGNRFDLAPAPRASGGSLSDPRTANTLPPLRFSSPEGTTKTSPTPQQAQFSPWRAKTSTSNGAPSLPAPSAPRSPRE